MSVPEGPESTPVASLALVILDGWGLAEPGPGNAISLADTPTFDELWERYPHTQMSASGRDVGLPDGQMGNSEVGHLNLGAGSIVKQDLARIDDAVADGSFFESEALREACARAVASPRGRLHLIGLVSDGGVHSGWEHIEACIELAAREGVPDLVFHAFTDGRDTSPTGGQAYLEQVSRWLQSAGRFGTVGGRYFGMDRDKRWERTKLAYDAIVHARGAPRRRRGRGGPLLARGRRDRRVRQADRDRRLRRRCRRRRDHHLQLPPRPHAPDRLGARRGGLRRLRPRRRRPLRHHDDDPVPGRLALPGRVPAARAGDHHGGDDRRRRRQPAARRRDREVRARHLLLQRRPRGRVGGGGAQARRLPARRPDLRPQAGDERSGRRRRLLRRLERGLRRRLPLRDHQLRQPGHGRPYGRHPGGGHARSRPSTAASPRSSRRCTRAVAPA